MNQLLQRGTWKILALVNTISLVIVTFLVGIQIPAFSMWFYRWQFDVNNTYEMVNMEPADLHQVTEHMIRYMQLHYDRDTGLQIETVVGGEVRPFFSDLEIRHMVDVYDLFEAGFLLRNVLLILAVITFVLFFTIGRRYVRTLMSTWKMGSLSVAGLLAIFGIAMAVAWVDVWHYLHTIFFNNDYWLLNPNVDLLINIVPYEFFLTTALFVVGTLLLGLVVMFVVSTVVLKR